MIIISTGDLTGLVCYFFKILDEPGEDSTKFDVFMPTIVKPLMPPAQIQTPKIGPDGQQVIWRLQFFVLLQTKLWCWISPSLVKLPLKMNLPVF